MLDNDMSIEDLQKEYRKVKQDLKFINLLINKYDNFLKNINSSKTINTQKINKTYRNLNKRKKALCHYLNFIESKINQNINNNSNRKAFLNSYNGYPTPNITNLNNLPKLAETNNIDTRSF